MESNKNGTTSPFKKDLVYPSKYVQIAKLATFPDSKQFLTVAAVSAGGITAMGVLGYVIFLIMSALPG